MTKTGRIFGAKCWATASFLSVTVLAARAALATPIPPPVFTYDVFHDGTHLSGCTSITGSSAGGTCGSETSGPGYAATSGGIGTASYLPVTPGGTVLGTGTAVDAMSTWTSGSADLSDAKLAYSFEATGPSDIDFIPIDVLSTSLIDATGDSTAFLSLVITDEGTDANIPPGVPDPDPPGPLLKLTEFCSHGSCLGAWGTTGQQLTSALCVVNGDNYVVTIDALTTAGPGFGTNSASAVLDPEIKVDPPYPTSCPEPPGLSPTALAVDTSPGTSTGFVTVPEPSTVGLGAIGLLALGFFGTRRRRVDAR